MTHDEMIKKAAQAQALDEGLWCSSQSIAQAYLQESLRDLHRVIEDFDNEAFERILKRLSP